MARKKVEPPAPPAVEESAGPVVTRGGVDVPMPRTVTSGAPVLARTVQPVRRVTAAQAGAASKLFPEGGSAFAAFCRKKGVNPDQLRPVEEYELLLKEFAERPVSGHRRKAR